jgi:hypothetical protein
MVEIVMTKRTGLSETMMPFVPQTLSFFPLWSFPMQEIKSPETYAESVRWVGLWIPGQYVESFS